MNDKTLLDDLEAAARIAKEGRDSPLLGGPIGMMWGLLLTVTLGLQYLILARILEVPEWWIAILWIAFGLTGGIGSTLLARRIEDQPGATSVGNQVESAVWTMFAAMMAVAFVAALAATGLDIQDHSVWGLIVTIGFLGQGLAYGVTTRIRSSSTATFASLAAFAAGAIALMHYDQIIVYLIGAIGSFIAIVLPCLFKRRV